MSGSQQRELGHAGLEITNRYIHLAADQLAVIQERVAPVDKIEVKPMKVQKGRWSPAGTGTSRFDTSPRLSDRDAGQGT